jgi:hypothetical protein
MLPDFPELKAEVQKFVLAKLRSLVDTGDPVLRQIKGFNQHEGQKMQYEQQGYGTVQDDFERIGTQFEIPIGDVPNLVGEKLDATLAAIAEDLVRQSAKLFFDKMDQTCDLAGTSVDARGKPFSPELFLEMISTPQLEFGRDGKPESTFVMHPDMVPTMKKVAEQIENDPELKRRHTEILERQREAWAARESNRKLVD